MEHEAADRAGSGDRLRPQAAAAGSRRGHRFRQPRHHPRSRSRTTPTELEQAIRKTSAGGSTSLYNAIYIALKDLKKLVATNVEEIRRQAIVVLSDGEDTSSLLPFEEVLDLAKRSETAIYCDRPALERRAAPSSKGFKEAEFVLRQLAQETGGRAFFPNQVADLPSVYGQISDELSSQYTVGYTSQNPQARRRLAAHRRPGEPASS